MRSGFVGLVGRPNVGKSTLVNSIVGKKVAITTSKPQTTRNVIQGIYNEEDTQIVFLDTPGIHKPNHRLGELLNRQAYGSMEDADVLLFLVDAKEPLGKGDEFIIERLKKVKKPVILVLNKIDKLSKEDIMKKILEYKDLYDFQEIIPVSALKKENLMDLIKTLKEYLPDEIRYYGESDTTNRPLEFMMAEIVREKVMDLTEEEVPHSLTCITSAVEVGKTSYTIYVDIIVDRDSLKKIVVGAHGSMIKEIGIRARKDLEKMLNKNVYLNLRVKTVKDWRDKEKYLEEYGFHDFEE